MADGTITEKIKTAPTTFGVYLFKDSNNRIIYIGKAKNLRSRLKSYTGNVSGLDFRKQKMVQTAKDVSFIVTDNELEALALEANLIKQNHPKYNVLLRDDKNYPYIRIDLSEEWPRVEVVRRIKKDKALHFGPYIPAAGLKETLSFIRRYFNIRPCRYSLLEHMKPCVQYQMGRCPAPCGDLISQNEYMKYVREVISFLQGKNKGLLDTLTKNMRRLSDTQEYEEAAKIRDRIQAIEKIWDKQKVVSPRMGEIDVIGLYNKGKDTAIVQLFIRNGLMTGSKEFFLHNAADIAPPELIHSFMEMLYSNQIIPPSRIVLQYKPSASRTVEAWLSGKRGSRVFLEVPKKGQKKQLVDMAGKNARIFMDQYKVPDFDETLMELTKILHLTPKPSSIGAFDISTIMGTGSVGAFIVWENGDFQKDLYRYANIKTVRGMDDYAMMEETVKRLLKKIGGDIPDLIIIDGGKGQLKAARKALSVTDIMPGTGMIAIAKDPDRVFTHTRGNATSIENNKPSSLLLKNIRDEAHRFAITRHRKARKSKLLTSSLEEIPGVGKKRRLALLKRFGSIDGIKKASPEEISQLRGFNKPIATKIKEHVSG